MPSSFADTAFLATSLLVILLLFVGNVLLGVAVWRSGTLPRWAGTLGDRACVDVSLGTCVRVDDRDPEHPADGARWRCVDGDRRGVDGLQCPSPTHCRDGGGRPSPTERAITQHPRYSGSLGSDAGTASRDYRRIREIDHGRGYRDSPAR